MTTSIEWTGKNTRDVRKFLAEHGTPGMDPKAQFLSRRGPGMTETLWLNVADEDWDKDVSAVLWFPSVDDYGPVRVGDQITAADGDLTIERKQVTA